MESMKQLIGLWVIWGCCWLCSFQTPVLAQEAVCPANTFQQKILTQGILCAIQPSLTEPQIKDTGGTSKGFGYHIVAIPHNPTTIKGTFLYLMGAGGIPYATNAGTFQVTELMQEAMTSGYLAITLAYANSNGGTIGNLCEAQDAIHNCYGLAHHEIIYGEDTSTVVSVDSFNSVMYRLDALLVFLKANSSTDFPFPAALAGPTVDWSQMRLGGHSEGGGNAGTMAQDFRVQQICYLAAPADYRISGDQTLSPPWIETPFATPTSLMRGLVHMNDTFYDGIAINYDALWLPPSTSETVLNNNWVTLTRTLTRPHTGITYDNRFAYARTWACFEDAPLVQGSVTDITPRAAPVGTTIVLTGTELASTQRVLMNGLEVPFTVVSDSQLTALVTSVDNTGPVSLHTRKSGAFATGLDLRVSPVATELNPVSGPVGTAVVIAGTGFAETTAVAFNGIAVPFTVDSDTQLTAVITSGSNTGTLAISTAAGTAYTDLGFVVLPALADFSPALGPVDTVITLTGTGFSGATKVSIGWIEVRDFQIESDTQIVATVASDTPSGLVRVTGPLGLTATSATEFTIIVSPTLTGFSPLVGIVGTVVTIEGANLTGTTAIVFNGVSSSFTVAAENLVRAVVPEGATTGPVTLTNPAGSVTSGDFAVYPQPVVTSFSPETGPVGTQLTIAGTGLTGTTSVTVGFAEAAFTVDSDAQITVTVAEDTPTGLIRVTNPAATGASTNSFVLIQPPTFNLSPTAGPAGMTVTLTGTSLGTTTGVSFNGIPTTFTVVSGTTVKAVVPVGATTGPITLTNPAGNMTSAESFTVYPMPTVTAFSPSSGPVGTVVTMTGTGFTSTSRVRFGMTDAASFTVDSDTQLTAVVAADTTSGTVRVTNPAGTASTTAEFIIIQPLLLTSFSPANATVGMEVTIKGTSLGTTTGVSFNGIPATFTVVSGTTVKAVVPEGATTGPITLTNPAGSVTSANFAVYPQPVVTSFTPETGQVATSLTITGTGFTGVTAVGVGLVEATAFTVVSDTQIIATVAVGTTTGAVRVSNPAVNAVSTTNFTVIQPPMLTSLSTSQGIPGTVVTLTGTSLGSTTGVTFNGTPATFTVVSGTSVKAGVPTGATTGPITVTNPAGSVTSAVFTVHAVPKIASFTPARGPVGTTMTIMGTGFTGATAVTVGFIATTGFTVASDTQITCTVAPGTPTGLVRVVNPATVTASTTSYTVK
ncbi:BPSS1187 family protein [Candidatus Cyanaurora vandensis]|uniref:beta strand repeat-containing protein n=1 Tax=Candidatus Cyanaurora vandensis TaxID=2714958 RepID=UPI00257BA724|nr:IPT/TIG domain-containing protein [Candidatus Cyanaurora vandensis]